jgi:signal transduction histidine kinase/ActR/RegA family two-component response regulator
VLAFAIGILWSAIGFNLWRDYQVAGADAANDTVNLARAFEENITRTVEAVDQTLLFVRDAYRRDPATFDLGSWAHARSFLNDLQVQIAIADRSGKVVWSNLGPTGTGVDLSDREHFRAQMASREDALYISQPVIGRVSNKKTIQFVRPLLAADGTFDGIVIVSLDPYYLSRFYESIEVGNGSILLINDNGVILAHAPGNATVTELPIGAKDQLLLNGGSGTFRGASRIDGVERIYSFRRVENYPLAVGVGLAVHDVFSTYERNKRLYLIGGILLTAASIAVGIIMLRQRRSILESRQALAVTLDNMSQGIMMIRADGTVPVVNRRAIELLDLPASLMSQRPNFQEIVAWQMANQEFGRPATWGPALTSSLQANRPSEGSHLYERRRPDGTVLEVRTRSLPDLGAVRTYTDITERKRNEEALAAAHARAAHAERMQALGQLAGGIAHDFNNILQIVQGGASLIEKQASDAESSERLARMIFDATQRGTSITRRLLSFARRGELRAEPVEVGPLLDELRDVLSHTLGSPIAVSVDLERQLPLLLADKGQLETVLVNLAANARDAMHHGGTLAFTVAVETVGETDIHPADLRPGRYVRLSIRDTGIGMDKSTLGRVLEPFFTTKPLGKGTGLGLPMAKGFVEQSGGGLLIDSVLGHGTTVHLWLPAVDTGSHVFSHETVVPAPRGSAAKRVLLVDDEPMVRESLAESLEDAGYAVLVAKSGAEALRLLDAGDTVDILVTDLAMPGIGGLTVIRQAQRRRPGLPAVLLTGYAGDGAQLAISGALSGAFSLLRKPVTAAQLADRIEALLAVAPAAGRGSLLA